METALVSDMITGGITSEGVGALLVAGAAFYLLFEARRLLQAYSRYRRVQGNDNIAKGVVVQFDGNQATTRWRITGIGFSSLALVNVDDPLLTMTLPLAEVLNGTMVFSHHAEGAGENLVTTENREIQPAFHAL